MTDKVTLMALAERCEKATGPDRELEALIYAETLRKSGDSRPVTRVGPPAYNPERLFFNPIPDKVDWLGYDLLNNAPAYTSSLDAAMTLVPPDHHHGYSTGAAGIAGVVQGHCFKNEIGSTYCEANAATPALALTAACLRARAA